MESYKNHLQSEIITKIEGVLINGGYSIEVF